MIQLQIVIDLRKTGTCHVQFNRLAREDANENEAALAAVFVERLEEMMREVATLLRERGADVTHEEIE